MASLQVLHVVIKNNLLGTITSSFSVWNSYCSCMLMVTFPRQCNLLDISCNLNCWMLPLAITSFNMVTIFILGNKTGGGRG